MSLFLNTSSLHNNYLDCCAIDISETIEHDCLSVLHKLHDQVNGLQLVQVVVQPLAKLFNPANLAALAANPAPPPPQTPVSNANASTSGVYHPEANAPASHLSTGSHNNADLEGVSASQTTSSTALNNQSTHSRAASFVSSLNANHSTSSGTNNTSNALLTTSSTYMMSPDTAQALIARLDTDRDVNWLMEIIGYGLSMPFSLTGEQDSVKDCCTIYCEWLASALMPYNELSEDSKYQQLSKLVPVPIRKDPNRYARKMLSHLYNVFLPRQPVPLSTSHNQKDQTDATLTAVSRQAVLCHRVLRTIESIAQNPHNLMDGQTWNHLLALLLTVNDKLLSAPTEHDDIGTQLQDRILGVLFELMLLASARSIPSPGLWKTFHQMCLNWRHRPALVDHWKMLTLTLTKRIVTLSSLPARGGDRIDTDTSSTIEASKQSVTTNLSPIEAAVASMTHEHLSQTWYRFLNLIGNLVELADPDTISRTDEFYHSACASDNVLDPRQHPCLNVLPQVFLSSMVALREFIDTFLGTYEQLRDDRVQSELNTPDRHSYNQSARGSITSLSGLPNMNQLNQSAPSHQQASHSSHIQPQATTPTASRRPGIKSLAIKGSKSSSQSSGQGVSQQLDASPIHEHPKSGSISSSSRIQQQFTQQRPSLTSLSSRTSQPEQSAQFKFYAERPKCNSILHIFGDWLFSAALIGSELSEEIVDAGDSNVSEAGQSMGSTSTATELGESSRSPSLRRLSNQTTSSSQASFSTTKTHSAKAQDLLASGGFLSEKMTLDSPLTSADSFELGQAEAMAILCKIFSSKSSTEDISPSYLSRFYLCFQHCLSFGTGQEQMSHHSSGSIRRQLLASVLINSTTLLQKDLDGINLLIPSIIKAIEFVFECGEKDIPVQPPPRQYHRSGSMRQGNPNAPISNVSNFELRRACIMTLVNLLAYPFHFQDLVIRNCLNDSSPTTTFRLLRPRLLKLLFIALQTETDPTNMQILFGGLSLAIHDLSSTDKTSSASKSAKSRQRADSISSAPGGDDNTNDSKQDDTMSQSSFVFNSSGGFLIKSLHVTCHLLINIWKHDTQVSLAALEVLSTIARVSTTSSSVGYTEKSQVVPRIKNNNNNNSYVEMRNEYMQTTKWICDYICNQCSRPPPAHSRDMHSTIVAAYQCLSVWFYNHPYLLRDGNCVNTLMEVIELGVSGQKSKSSSVSASTGASGHSIVAKAEKLMKPSSMRVREAAESLLNICMVRGANPGGCLSSIATSDTMINEIDLADLFGGSQYKSKLRQIQDRDVRQMEAYKLFKYFSDEDSVIFGLLDGLNHDPTTRDSVICLLRTPFGKHSWKMRFNYYTEKSRDKIIANKTLGLIKRPFQCTTPVSEPQIFPFSRGHNKSLYFNNSAKFFPESLESIAPSNLDKLVTSLDEYVGQTRDSRLKNDIDKISKIFDHQVMAEQKVVSECSVRVKRVECEEPQPLTELETARVIITHLGLKTSLSCLGNGDKMSADFVGDLKSLDCQSVRTYDTVNIFYVRKNRTSPREILESVQSRHNVSLSFFEWLLELGHPTIVKNHSRWTGKMSSSWTNKPAFYQSFQKDGPESHTSLSCSQMLSSDHGGAIFDGERMTIYWSDMCQELAFLVPHRIEKNPTSMLQIGDTNIIVCWLECSDDAAHLPSDTLLSISETGNLVEEETAIGSSSHSSSPSSASYPPTPDLNRPRVRDSVRYIISPMKNGLYRVNLTTSFGRQWLALPLVDGMTVSKGILSGLIRESVLNLCRRRRLDADSYQPPHVKRRLKIQEICNSYKLSSRHESAEFYSNLFKSKAN